MPPLTPEMPYPRPQLESLSRMGYSVYADDYESGMLILKRIRGRVGEELIDILSFSSVYMFRLINILILLIAKI